MSIFSANSRVAKLSLLTGIVLIGLGISQLITAHIEGHRHFSAKMETIKNAHRHTLRDCPDFSDACLAVIDAVDK